MSLARRGCATLGVAPTAAVLSYRREHEPGPRKDFKMLQALFNLILGGFGATGAAITDVVNWED